MQQQQPPPQSNIMLTSLDKIPLKPSNNTNIDDMSDDPIVKDVLSEFEKELLLNEKQANNYNINYQQQSQQQQQPLQQQQQQQPQQQQQQQQHQQHQQYQQPQRTSNSKNLNNYIDNILITKTFIICIIVALIINPYIYNTIISKIPTNLSTLFDSYNYFIKLGLIFIAIYLFMFYKLV
jgi:Fe2+ transport system protein B